MEYKYWEKLSPCGKMTIYSSWVLFSIIAVDFAIKGTRLLEAGEITSNEFIMAAVMVGAFILGIHYGLYRLIKFFDGKCMFSCKK